jgi:hypothetical protein
MWGKSFKNCILVGPMMELYWKITQHIWVSGRNSKKLEKK